MMDEAQTAPNETAEAEVIAVTHAMPEKPARDWRGWTVLGLAAAAAASSLLGPVGAGWGLWHFSIGIQAQLLAAALAALALVLGLLFVWLGKRSPVQRPKMRLWLGTLMAVAMLGWLGSYLAAARGAPLHDISTDLADPPEFKQLVLRADNTDSVPGQDDPAMKAMTPEQRWVQLHQKLYGDIRSVRVNQNVGEVIAKAERLAKARGWDVALSLPAEGRLEATATSRLFKFKDDVVLRVRPTEKGDGSIVDMRSVSRVGQSDLGVNAKRVRSFLADLSGTVTAG
jgi:Protein of unknown function (DUF1499)